VHHRDGHHQHHQLANLVFLHPNGHRQVYNAPGSTTDSRRPSQGVGYAGAECRETGPLRSEGAGWTRAHLATRRRHEDLSVLPPITAFANLARILFLGVLLTVSMNVFSQDDQQKGVHRTCTTQSSLVGPCFNVRGRLALYNGTPSARIWKVGTQRLLGVSDSRCQRPECPQMPQELADRLSWEHVIFGEFRVCPFTESRPGHMQLVCIASAKNLVVRERR
jgi:hypothetical protein